ncbi:hypothetical protein BB8028_0006g01210 [Beauveria bassiana]|uniref:Uncharacterized protein n=1 Tax=Beauveria bassiana TaxID=176275 RepID=A0A2S7YIK9_BEABA|nr:hypothetical protein BB8028_0006g01210 [Beauveria bassiana]
MSIALHRPSTLNSTLVGYVGEPNGRGTLSLLFSCVFTLFLCVWSAVHLNLPELDESPSSYSYRYFKWSLLGLFGPELVIWAAWRQYISAQSLTKIIRKDLATESDDIRAQQWTMIHSFYTGMGGFVFDLTPSNEEKGSPFITTHKRLHVTPRGIQLLAKCGLLPCITTGDITDKSKTDWSGKAFCCLQVSWMVIQAIARAATGLPVTPLETNTIGHVVCALINYTLWWNKPRWDKEPTVLRGGWTEPLCAFMYMSSQVSAEKRIDRDLLRDFGVKAEMTSVLYFPGDGDGDDSHKKCHIHEQYAIAMDPQHDPILQPSDGTVQFHSIPVPLKGASSLKMGRMGARTKPLAQNPREEVLESFHANVRQRRWDLVCEAIQRYPILKERLEPKELNEDELRYREALRLYPEMPETIKQQFQRRCGVSDSRASAWHCEGLVCRSEELVVERPRNWPGDDLVRNMQGHLMGLVLWNASTVYGAIHLAGWHEAFPTVLESWFWRVSAMYIIFSGLLWSFLNLLGHVSGHVWWYWYEILAGGVRRRSHVVIYVLCCIGGTLYIVARVFLVLEAFISIRALPASAYQSPSWVLTVPHI